MHAVGNVDPFSGAAVLSRGIVGDRGGRATVQSPILKQAFSLEDGSCLDDPRVSVPVYQVRVTPDGQIQIATAGCRVAITADIADEVALHRRADGVDEHGLPTSNGAARSVCRSA